MLPYGVLRGRVDRFQREDDLDSPHLQIRVVDAQSVARRVAVNVLSGDQSRVIFHHIDPLHRHAVTKALAALQSGFTLLPPAVRSAKTALDYFRAPLFDWTEGIAIPPSGPGQTDDLQDALVLYLTQLQAQGGELFAFGARFPLPGQPANPRPIDREFQTSEGLHDVHLNQGNANPGRFAADNGVFQDGGLILAFPTRFVGLFLRFQTQWLPTDNATGHRLPNARPILLGDDGSDAEPDVYIERALVNPAGGDSGQEVVVLGNLATRVVDLTGWVLVDRNQKEEPLALSLPPGESRPVVLSGRGAQLGNQGGTIQLRDPAGVQVHAVSYAAADAKREARYLRFPT
jgi:uncharacterized protein YukJ